MPRLHQINICLTAEELGRIKDIAAQTGRRAGAVCRDIILDVLDDDARAHGCVPPSQAAHQNGAAP